MYSILLYYLQDSIRSANLQRYYLHPKEQIITTLYLWNLPAQSLQTTDSATTYVKTIVANGNCKLVEIHKYTRTYILHLGSVVLLYYH